MPMNEWLSRRASSWARTRTLRARSVNLSNVGLVWHEGLPRSRRSRRRVTALFGLRSDARLLTYEPQSALRERTLSSARWAVCKRRPELTLRRSATRDLMRSSRL